MLGLAAVAILALSAGAVYAIAAQSQYQQSGSFAGMIGGRGYGGGMMGQMAQQMGGFWSHATNGSENVRFLTIADNAFHPPTITVLRGTTVTWVNMDFVQHTVTSGTEQVPAGLFDSHPLSHMQSFSYTFNTPGTYSYFCDLHPNMIGTIRVTG